MIKVLNTLQTVAVVCLAFCIFAISPLADWLPAGFFNMDGWFNASQSDSEIVKVVEIEANNLILYLTVAISSTLIVLFEFLKARVC